MLDDGVCGTIEELPVQRERVNRGYMSRVLRLTLLAPDLLEAILDGRRPLRAASHTMKLLISAPDASLTSSNWAAGAAEYAFRSRRRMTGRLRSDGCVRRSFAGRVANMRWLQGVVAI